METGLFDIRAERLCEFRQARQVHPDSRRLIYAMFGDTVDRRRERPADLLTDTTEVVPSSGREPDDPAGDLARCFLRVANLPSCPLDRLSPYEAILWRQAGQIVFALDTLVRRKPQERAHRFRI
jgi:hypothetical protein